MFKANGFSLDRFYVDEDKITKVSLKESMSGDTYLKKVKIIKDNGDVEIEYDSDMIRAFSENEIK